MFSIAKNPEPPKRKEVSHKLLGEISGAKYGDNPTLADVLAVMGDYDPDQITLDPCEAYTDDCGRFDDSPASIDMYYSGPESDEDFAKRVEEYVRLKAVYDAWRVEFAVPIAREEERRKTEKQALVSRARIAHEARIVRLREELAELEGSSK